MSKVPIISPVVIAPSVNKEYPKFEPEVSHGNDKSKLDHLNKDNNQSPFKPVKKQPKIKKQWCEENDNEASN